MRRQEQLSEYLRSIIGKFISQKIDFQKGVLVTVTRVDIGQSRHKATVWISVLPESQAEKAFALLEKHLYPLQATVNKLVCSHPAPRISLRLDEGPIRSARIEKLTRCST